MVTIAAEIKTCTCESKYQDKVHGIGKRVHNKTVKPEGWRCTVCGTHKK